MLRKRTEILATDFTDFPERIDSPGNRARVFHGKAFRIRQSVKICVICGKFSDLPPFDNRTGTGIMAFGEFVLKNNDPTSVTLAKFFAEQVSDYVPRTTTSPRSASHFGGLLFSSVGGC